MSLQTFEIISLIVQILTLALVAIRRTVPRA